VSRRYRPRQVPSAPPPEPDGHADGLQRLAACGEVLTIEEVARVLRIGVRTIEAQEQQGTFPIGRMTRLGTGTKYRPRRYAKEAVEAYLHQQRSGSFRRSA
jgi:hypothetical protein